MKKFSASVLLTLTLLISACVGKQTLVPANPFLNPSHRIAVLPFSSSNPYIEGAVLGDFFTVQIVTSLRELEVIERKDLRKLLQEQKLTLSGVVRPEDMSRLGSILGVEAILIGSIETLETIQGDGGAIAVTIKLMEVATGRILWADKQKISHTTWMVREVPEIVHILMEKTAKKMVGKMEKGFSSHIFFQPDRVLPSAVLNEAKLN